MEKYNIYIKARNFLSDFIKENGKDIIRECFAPLFEKNPEILKISWTNNFLVDSGNSGFQTEHFAFLVKESDVEFKNVSDSGFKWIFDSFRKSEDGYIWIKMPCYDVEKFAPQFTEGMKAYIKPCEEIFENTFDLYKIDLNRDGTFEIDESYDGYYVA